MAEYIEREALIAFLNEDMVFCKHALDESPFSKGVQTGLNAGINYATVLPAADEVERKRGRWTAVKPNGIGATARCSICGDAIYGYNTMNFCPNCGADMREVNDAN